MATLQIHRMGVKTDVWQYWERDNSDKPTKFKKTTSLKKITKVIEDASGRGVKIMFTGRGITYK